MSFPLLLRLDAARLGGALRRPRAGAWIGTALPLALAAGALWAAGPAARPEVGSAGGGATLGMLIAAPPAFVAYGVLFRPSDGPFLRRLGVEPPALYAERALRLLLLGLGVVALAMLPFVASGTSVARPACIGLTAALAAWGVAAAAFSAAARAMTRRRPGRRWGLLSLGMWDRELAATAPLVWAPVAPLLTGFAAGAWAAAAPGTGAARAAVAALMALGLAALAARPWAAALPRFGAQAQEMSFVPPPAEGGAQLSVGRGLGRLLPRRAAAAWARDAVVGGRRFAWAGRVVWPVAIVSFVALARWGRVPGTRAWVAAAVVGVWLAQAAAVVALGRLEAQGTRWLDRSVGIAPLQRILGRWAWGWGLALWLAVPLSFAWSWWAAGAGWPWLLVAGATSGVAALASAAAAGWR